MSALTICRCGAPAKKFGRYVEDAADQRWRCLECGRTFIQNRDHGGGHFLPGPQRAELKRLLLAGVPNRLAGRFIGTNHNTVRRYYRLWDVRANCPCGAPSTHQGWCQWRLSLSPDRRSWLYAQWEKRCTTDVSVLVDEATRLATTHWHTLGPFVWGAEENAGCWPYAKCLTCTCSVRIHGRVIDDGLQIEGTAVREQCLTETEVVAQWERQEERRWHRLTLQTLRDTRSPWREGKRTLSQLRQILRDPSRWPLAASTLVLTSPV